MIVTNFVRRTFLANIEAASRLRTKGVVFVASNELPKAVDVAAFEDTYKLEIFPTRNGPYRVRILRVFAPQA